MMQEDSHADVSLSDEEPSRVQGRHSRFEQSNTALKTRNQMSGYKDEGNDTYQDIDDEELDDPEHQESRAEAYDSEDDDDDAHCPPG